MNEDTILAVSTPVAPAAAAVLRISGPDAREHARGLLSDYDAGTGFRQETVTFDWEGVPVPLRATTFLAPRSYTGEDLVELTIPGSLPLVSSLMRRILRPDEGGPREPPRPARAGEFTLRAFLNGKMDLCQAEAVGRLIHAGGESEARAAYRQIGGALGSRVSSLVDAVTKILALAEVAIDFPDEEIPAIAPRTLVEQIQSVEQQLDEFLRHSALRIPERGNVRIAVLGLPNAGKSSLVNSLVGRPVALVSGFAGTTRDPVRGFSRHAGRQFEWVDLAGLEESSWTLEGEESGDDQEFPFRAAIQRLSERELEQADVALYLVDGTRIEPETLQNELPDDPRLRHRSLLVISKVDLLGEGERDLCAGLELAPTLVSARTGEGLDELQERIVTLVERSQDPGSHHAVTPGGHATDVFLLSPLQQSQLESCRDALVRASGALESEESGTSVGGFELAAVDLREGLMALEPLVGREVSERVLGTIFGQFCIGK